MYCKFCGEQIDENAVFCTRCGKAQGDRTNQNQTQPQKAVNPVRPVVNTNKKAETGKYITKASFNPSGVIGLMVFSSILTVIAIIVLIAANNVHSSRGFINTDNQGMFVALSIIVFISEIISLASGIYSLSVNSDIRCIVYEKKIVGKAVNSRFSTTRVDFSFYYDEIENVSVNKRIISIFSNGLTYYVAAANSDQADYVAKTILEKMGDPTGRSINSTVASRSGISSKNNWSCPKCGMLNPVNSSYCNVCSTAKPDTSTSYTQNQEIWICPNCGKQNQNYVGTCGCGTRKP